MFFQTSRLFRDLPPSSQTPPTSPGIHFRAHPKTPYRLAS